MKLRIFVSILTVITASCPAYCRDQLGADCAVQNLKDDLGIALLQTVRLYGADGRKVSNYSSLVASLKPGDQIDFGKGAVFPFHGYLNPKAGNTAWIIDIGNGKVLRVPKTPDSFFGFGSSTVRLFTKLGDQLRREGVPFVEEFPGESRSPDFLVVKKLNLQFTLAEFEALIKQGKIPPSEVARIQAAFLDFARKTWKFTDVDDLMPWNIGFDGQHWICFDVGALRGQIDQLESWGQNRNVFSPVFVDDDVYYHPLSPAWEREANRVIAEERAHQRASGNWLDIGEPTPTIGKKFYSYTVVRRLKSEEDDTFKCFEVKSSDGSPAVLKILRKPNPKSKLRLSKLIEKKRKKYKVLKVGSDFVFLRGSE